MKRINEALVETLQALDYPKGEYEIHVYGPLVHGKIMIRNGRIRFARANKLEAFQALKQLLFAYDSKHSVQELESGSENYVDEMNCAPSEVILPLVISYDNQESSNPEDAITVKLDNFSAVDVLPENIHNYDITLECQNPEWDGLSFALHEGRNLIGRSEQCSVRIENNSISRIQALVTITSRGISLEDMQSTNGTKVNGQAVIEVPLQAEDTIEIGELKFKIVYKLKMRGGSSSHESTWHQSGGFSEGTTRKAVHFENYEKLQRMTFGIGSVLDGVFGKDDHKLPAVSK